MKSILRRTLALWLVLIIGLLGISCDQKTATTTGEETTIASKANTTGTEAATTTLLLTTETTEGITTTVAETTTEPIEENLLPPEIKNVILIIGDGMGLEHIAAGEMAYGVDYAFTEWQFANVKTNSYDESVSAVQLTDSAASATALATGVMTHNSYVGKDFYGRNLTTILDYAKQRGKRTGIVTTDYLHGATPGGFSAHSLNRNNSLEILYSQAQSGVDFLCGAQDSYALQARSAYEAEGYHFVDDYKKVRYCNDYEKVCCAVPLEGHTEDARLTLRSAALAALSFLEQDEDGFVLMIEQAHVDKYSHSNDIDGAIRSVQSLANTVSGVMQWMGEREDTAILITADHETGGLNVSGEMTLAHRYQGTKNAVYYQWTTTNHTNSNVALFIYAPYVELEQYSYYRSEYMVKNTDIIKIMKGLMKPVETVVSNP